MDYLFVSSEEITFLKSLGLNKKELGYYNDNLFIKGITYSQVFDWIRQQYNFTFYIHESAYYKTYYAITIDDKAFEIIEDDWNYCEKFMLELLIEKIKKL